MESATDGLLLAEFIWYGVLSAMFLLCFASLTFEVEHGLKACEHAGNDDAWKVTWKTCNVNFVVMLCAHLLVIFSLYGIHQWQGDAARMCLAAVIAVAGSYWSYTRACEKKLVLFLKETGIYPPSYCAGSLRKLFRKR